METLDKLIDQMTEEINVKPKRVVTPSFETTSRLESVKPDILTRGEKKRYGKRKREATAGSKWFDLPAKDLEVEDKLTIDAIRLRDTLDPSRFYKKKAVDTISKHFQVGTVIEHPVDYYSGRATRKEKKQTLVDELIADSEFKRNVKKRYARIRATNAIKHREKALAERRKLLQGKKKKQKD